MVVHQIGVVIHTKGTKTRPEGPEAGMFSVGRIRCGRPDAGSRGIVGATPSVGVDQLADGCDLAAKLVVDGGFAGDLVAGMEDGRVVAPSQLSTDPEK